MPLTEQSLKSLRNSSAQITKVENGQKVNLMLSPCLFCNL